MFNHLISDVQNTATDLLPFAFFLKNKKGITIKMKITTQPTLS